MVTKIISILNEKGGVGKTTVSLHLSRILSSASNWKVLILDNDPQGNLTSSLTDKKLPQESNIYNLYSDEPVVPFQVNERLHLIGSDSSLSKQLSSSDIDLIYKLHDGIEKLKSEYDFILIDCLPSFGQLNMSALMASDFVIIPVTPDEYSVSGLNSLMPKIAKVNDLKKRGGGEIEILGIVLNMVEGRETVIQSQFIDTIKNKYKDLLFDTRLTKSVKYSEAGILKTSIFQHDQERVGRIFLQFVKEVIVRVKKENQSKKVA